jgi:hypothetical protein
MLSFSRASVHLVPSTSLSRWRSTDTTAPTHYTDGSSVHPVLKDASPKRLCMLLRDRRIDRRYLWPWASVHPVLKRLSWRVSVSIQTKRRIDWRCPHLDRRIIWCYCLCCSSSATRPTLLENGPYVHPRCLGFHPVYQLVRQLHRRLLSRYRRFIRRYHFPSFSLRPQLGSLLQLNILNILNSVKIYTKSSILL